MRDSGKELNVWYMAQAMCYFDDHFQKALKPDRFDQVKSDWLAGKLDTQILPAVLAKRKDFQPRDFQFVLLEQQDALSGLNFLSLGSSEKQESLQRLHKQLGQEQKAWRAHMAKVKAHEDSSMGSFNRQVSRQQEALEEAWQEQSTKFIQVFSCADVAGAILLVNQAKAMIADEQLKDASGIPCIFEWNFPKAGARASKLIPAVASTIAVSCSENPKTVIHVVIPPCQPVYGKGDSAGDERIASIEDHVNNLWQQLNDPSHRLSVRKVNALWNSETFYSSDREPGASPAICGTAWTAKLLELPLAPVTLHAAAAYAAAYAGHGGRSAGSAGSSTVAGWVKENIWEVQELPGGLMAGFIRFAPPLPSAPQLVHLAEGNAAPRLTVTELTERGMILQLHISEPLEELAFVPFVIPEDLHLLYTAGTCQGRLCFARRSAAPRGAATAAADFVPRLQRPPETVLVQSWKASASSPVRHVARVARCSRRGFALSGDWSVLAALRYEALGAEVPLHAELLQQLAPLPEESKLRLLASHNSGLSAPPESECEMSMSPTSSRGFISTGFQPPSPPAAPKESSAIAPARPRRQKVEEGDHGHSHGYSNSHPRSRLPVTVLTGYLGAGKTTLLNYILKEQQDKKLAVIENEIGEVSIDDALVEQKHEDMAEELVLLNNGCICCTVRGDLIKTLHNIGRKYTSGQLKLDGVLIELTGMADPAPVVQTFIVDRQVQSTFMVDNVVALVDAKHGLEKLDESRGDPEKGTACAQIAFSSTVLLNKIDLVDETQLDKVTRRIKELNGAVEIIPCQQSRAPMNRLFNVGCFNLDKVLEEQYMDEAEFMQHYRPKMDKSVSNVGVRCEGQVMMFAFQQFLDRYLDEEETAKDFLRVKAVLNIAGSDRKFVLQCVHMLRNQGFTEPWGPQEKRENRIIFIGRGMQPRRRELTEGFQSCLMTKPLRFAVGTKIKAKTGEGPNGWERVWGGGRVCVPTRPSEAQIMGGVRRRGGRTRRSDDAKEAANEEGISLCAVGREHQATATKPKRASRASQGIKPEQDEVLQCIESLYQDKLKPFGRILRKRVAERHVEPFVAGRFGIRDALHGISAGRMELPDVDVQHLREVCEASESLLLTPEEGGDWSATFKDRSQHFVDIYSTTDDFAPSIWHAATQYFKTLPEEEALLPGGRYSCAQALLQRSLDFLEGFSLGEVCHLVQLAISKHKILGYCNGAVVPYSRSQSRVKEECAVSQQPCQAQKEDVANTKAPQLELASLTKARQCLKEILQSAELPDSTGPEHSERPLRMSSETSLGHSKLSELLQDERFADICEVQLQGQGYIVVQVLGDDWEEVEDLEVPRYTGSEEGLESLAVDCALTPLTPVQDDDGFPNPTEEVTPVLRTPLASPGLATPNTVSRWTVYNWGMQGHSMWGEAPPLPLGGGAVRSCAERGERARLPPPRGRFLVGFCRGDGWSDVFRFVQFALV
eukprot:g944.t1